MAELVGATGDGDFLVDLRPFLVACKCPYAVASESGRWRRTLAEVNPGTRMKDLSIAATNVDTAGDPYVACQNLTNSATESNRTADNAECVSTTLGTFVSDVDKDLKSTIHRPVLVSLLPWNTVLLAVCVDPCYKIGAVSDSQSNID